jgi:hypothetical protein
MMKEDVIGTFISCRGRLTKVLVCAARGKWEVRVGEVELGYRMLIAGNRWDFKMS